MYFTGIQLVTKKIWGLTIGGRSRRGCNCNKRERTKKKKKSVGLNNHNMLIILAKKNLPDNLKRIDVQFRPSMKSSSTL